MHLYSRIGHFRNVIKVTYIRSETHDRPDRMVSQNFHDRTQSSASSATKPLPKLCICRAKKEPDDYTILTKTQHLVSFEITQAANQDCALYHVPSRTRTGETSTRQLITSRCHYMQASSICAEDYC